MDLHIFLLAVVLIGLSLAIIWLEMSGIKMTSAKIKITDPIGIHARPASKLVNVSSKWKSEIKFKLNSTIANAKSIMNLMSLGAKQGSEIEMMIDGPDEKQAMQAMMEVLKEQKLI